LVEGWACIWFNVPIGRRVRLDTGSGARHLEPMPAQHGQTYDPQEEPAPSVRLV
jgi:hypothetical protein